MKCSSAEPLEQLGRLAHLLLVQRRRVLPEPGHDVLDLGVHLAPVLDGLADVAEHALDVLDDRGRVVALGQPVDLDVHPGLALRLALGLERAVRHRRHGLQLTRDVADHVEVGVDDHVHVAQLAGQLHGQRVDEERHVVHDDLDDRVPAGRPVLSLRVGVWTRTLAVPCGRLPASLKCEANAP